MSKSVNKVFILGNLGKDAVVKNTSSVLVAELSVATTEGKKTPSGQWEDHTEWHRVILFGRLAEVAEKYLKSGDKVYIEGRLQTRKWQDKSGQDRYTTEIVANEMVLLGGGKSEQTTARVRSYADKDDIPF